jgi:peptidyl-prolyl cis-trans isomerase SurA
VSIKLRSILNPKALVTSIAVFLSVSLPQSSAYAQQAINSIEVLVNDQPISTFDIEQRLRLVIAISGGVTTQEEFLKVREQVIRSMVDERLQIQEAAENDLTVGNDRLEDFFGRRAQSLGQTPEQLEAALVGIGTSKATMLAQFEAEIAWSQLVQGRLGPFVSVSDEEVDAFIQRIYDNKGNFEYRLGEIVLLVDSPSNEDSVKNTAAELVSRIKEGASFNELANQLSSSSSAAVGGDLGWVASDDLDGVTAEELEAIGVGNVSEPIRTPGGYTILTVADRRRILTADPEDAQVNIRQLHLTTAKTTDQEAVEKFKSVAVAAKANSATCEQIADLATEAGADGPQDIGFIRIRNLQGNIRSVVRSMEVNAPSDVIEMEDGMRVLFVCERRAPTVQEPDFDDVFNQLESQRMSMMARRYLRDLRRDAIVDYR